MEFSANDIAALLNGEVEGDGKVKVSNISKIDQSLPGTLTFLSNPTYTKYIYTTTASIVIVNKDFKAENSLSCTLIRVEDAYVALATLLDFYVKTQPVKVGVEQLSFVSNSATLGEQIYIGAFAYIGDKVLTGKNVKIYPQVYIGDNVKIGDNTILYSGVKIYANCSIGSSCILHSGAVIGADGFGFAPNPDGTYTKIEQIGNVIIEDNVEIGANTTVDSATMGSTIIRAGVKLDNLIQIGHNCEIGENTVMAAMSGVAGSTTIGKNCLFGGQVAIGGHITIGEGSKIGPRSGVMSPVKPNSVLLGAPALDFKLSMKIFSIIRNLPQLRDDVIELQKKIKSIENNE
ncbi:MAG: UDP-3-O-(3-hydroxymyristoyl)glucosamine N-acyltransferase [Bacteroidia bacterium]|nr:UDP-3-O-(3-hydroxymyristoyl)glucosamine N-acyltransferase [Bacteroidia bacterium]